MSETKGLREAIEYGIRFGYDYAIGEPETVGQIDERERQFQQLVERLVNEAGGDERAQRNDLTIRELQTRLPWSVRYSTDFRSSPVTHKDFAHALTHIVKAAGGLAELVDNMDHDRSVAEAIHTDYHKYVADMVICALRMANTMPGGVLDLQRAVQQRLETKNNVTLGGAP